MKNSRAKQMLVTFDSPTIEPPDLFGNVVTGWTNEFDAWAEEIQLRGGETVMAARLTNRHPQVLRIARNERSERITGEWRATADGVEFNIRDITPSSDRRYLDILCERGVAV